MASREKQQYVDTDMMTPVKAVFSLLFFVGLAAFSMEAKAAPTKDGSSLAQESSDSRIENSAKQSDNSKSAANDSDFVDKDGDGIRDGKEHRFRRRSKHNRDADRHTGKQRRKKGQKGKGSGS